MELKVWCEGIQRVVCGVTEATTCQDIVIVLAQAIGKTGRYTLVERWRDNERLISPSESPLLALSKWGEYANDVQFILRHSNGGSVLNSRHGNRSDGGSNRTSQIYDFSPHLSTKAHLSSSLRKSLTFSGAHSHSHLLSTRENGVCRHDRKCSIDKNSSLESLTESSHDAFTRSMPYLNANGDHRGLHNSSQSSQSSLATSSAKQSNHYVSQHGNIPFSYTSHPTAGGSLERTRRRNHSHYVHGRQSSDVSSTETSTALKSGEMPPRSTRIDIPSSHSSGVFSHRRDLTLTSLAHDKPLSFPRALKPIPCESNNNIDMKMNANLTGVISDQIGDDSRPRNDSTSSDNKERTKKSELMKLINRQTEQIQQLEEKIKALETDISLIEHFDHEPNENTNTSEEIIRLKKHDLDLDNEIQELELVSWEGKLELEQAKEMRLRAEIEMMTKNLNNCNAELNKLNSKIKELDEEMAKEKHLRNVEEKRGKEQEARISAEISDLQKQITERQEEHKKRQKCLDEMTNEKQNTEAEVGKKKAKITELEKELKETNLKTFIRSPSDLLRGSLEGRSILRRLSPTRPGSARRLDVPQCLKEAVPTSKNPHGLWV